MSNLNLSESQIKYVSSFGDFVGTPFQGSTNVVCWQRTLVGDFSEIVTQIVMHDNIIELHKEELQGLQLSEEGQLAREILLNDLKLLELHGAAPTLNLIKCYEKDDNYSIFPTDVYSYHVDRAPIAADTILCTYYGETSEILPNTQGIQKVQVPELRDELKKLFDGADEDFDVFLTENFFDLHYQPTSNANPIKLGLGHLCRLAIDHPESKVLPCLHRAPMENDGRIRLLLIC